MIGPISSRLANGSCHLRVLILLTLPGALTTLKAEQTLWESVVWIQDGDVVTAQLDGRSQRTMLTVPEWRFHFPRFSPDGKRLAVVRFDRANGNPEVCAYDLSGLSCIAAPGWTYGMSWHSDSKTIFYTRNEGDGQIWQIDFGSAAPAARLLFDPGVYRTFSLSVSKDGEEMVLVHDPSNFTCRNFLSIYNFETSSERTIFAGNGLSDFFPDFSPVRGEIAWAQNVSGCGADFNVWIIQSDGSNPTNLTPGFSNPSQQNPVFSMDGELIYFQHNGELWSMSRNGSDKETLFRMNPGSESVYFDVGTPFLVDTSPPEIIPLIAGVIGNAGWYLSDVEIAWAIHDPESAILSTVGCETALLTVDTAGESFSCAAASAGGTSEASATIKRDATLPLTSLNVPQDGDTYILGNPVLANWEASDSLSGLDFVQTPTFLGSLEFPVRELVKTDQAGPHDYFLRVADVAGNQREIVHSYLVVAPQEAIELLEGNIRGLGLSRGIEESLLAKLNAAHDSLQRGEDESAIHSLRALVNQIEALAGKKMTLEEADALIDKILRIIRGINSGSEIQPGFPLIVTVDGLARDITFFEDLQFDFDDAPYLEEAIESLGFPGANVVPYPWSRDAKLTEDWVADLRIFLRHSHDVAQENGQAFVVVAHSWGTFLSYAALAFESSQPAPLAVDRYITLGSPLGTENELPSPGFTNLPLWIAAIAFVAHWSNEIGLSDCDGCVPNVRQAHNIWAFGDVFSGPFEPGMFNSQSLQNILASSSGVRGNPISLCHWHWYDSLQPKTENPCALLDLFDLRNNQPLRNLVRELILGRSAG